MRSNDIALFKAGIKEDVKIMKEFQSAFGQNNKEAASKLKAEANQDNGHEKGVSDPSL